jgi:hypothetical protein
MDVMSTPARFTAPASDRPDLNGGHEPGEERPTESTLVPSTVWFGAFVPDSLEREFMEFLGTHNGVAVLTWPRDAAHAEHLARAGLPRLVLVPPSETPPPEGPLQDWLPSAASHAEIHGCLIALSRAAEARRAAAGPPSLDARGLLHVGDSSVAVPAIEQALAEVLVAHFEQPIASATLPAPSNSALPASLATRLRRLGNRVSPLALEIVAVPEDKYILRRCAHRPVSSTLTAVPGAPAFAIDDGAPERAHAAAPQRERSRRRTLPPHFRSGLLAPESPWSALESGCSLRQLHRR